MPVLMICSNVGWGVLEDQLRRFEVGASEICSPLQAQPPLRWRMTAGLAA